MARTPLAAFFNGPLDMSLHTAKDQPCQWQFMKLSQGDLWGEAP